MYDSNVSIPNIDNPLINEPGQAEPAAPTTALGPLQHFVGTWVNDGYPQSAAIADLPGNPSDTPYSFNLMPLPQHSASTGYILKNFKYYEELTFSAIHGNAPNRSGCRNQVANTLFYEQRVFFAEGPATDNLVHAENGSLLYLTDAPQPLGPYGDGQGSALGNQSEPPCSTPIQYPINNLVKQVSVPHGNSILAPGVVSDSNVGGPTIGVPQYVLPIPGEAGIENVSTVPYDSEGIGNPYPALARNPNQPLTQAITAPNIVPTQFIRLTFDSNHTGGGVQNINFENAHAKVTRYICDYWLEDLEGQGVYNQMQYSQTILMEMNIPGHGKIIFPHVTTNTLKRRL